MLRLQRSRRVRLFWDRVSVCRQANSLQKKKVHSRSGLLSFCLGPGGACLRQANATAQKVGLHWNQIRGCLEDHETLGLTPEPNRIIAWLPSCRAASVWTPWSSWHPPPFASLSGTTTACETPSFHSYAGLDESLVIAASPDYQSIGEGFPQPC